MVLVERRLFALLHQVARTGEYPVTKYVDISDSDSDNDYELELELPREPYRSRNPIHWLEVRAPPATLLPPPPLSFAQRQIGARRPKSTSWSTQR